MNRLLSSLLLFFGLVTASPATFAVPQLTPVDRLVENAEAYLREHPNEAGAHYTLARIHYLAFSTKRNQVPALPDWKKKPHPAPEFMRRWREPKDPPQDPLSNAQLIEHSAKAVKSFQDALRLDPKNGLYHLGLASLLEEFWNWSSSAHPTDLPEELRGLTIERFRESYAAAFDRAYPKDSKLTTQPLPGIQVLVSFEAASAIVRLAKDTTLTAPQRATMKLAKAAIAKFEHLPPGNIVTPIVVSWQPVAHLEDLLAPEQIVDFDLRGYGPRERWPWVKPELGFLVWDPTESGQIESARQLFGGYTFQIFRRTGYDALRALDDNRDGSLSGSELAGLSIWFDRNSDGRSSREEVTPLRELHVESIAANIEFFDGPHPSNAHGLKLLDGRTLQTWDWIVEPARSKEVTLSMRR
jgi:hypothetical protein